MIFEISVKNNELLEEFIATMGNSSDSFRYFKTRPISVIENHLCTVLLLQDDRPIGYGHLDKEGDDVWFGIAVAHDFVGQGKGKLIMQYLVDKADFLKLSEIKLSVDENNKHAIKMYIKYGFVEIHRKNGVLFFSRKRML